MATIPWGGHGPPKPTGMIGPGRGNLKTGGVKWWGRVQQRVARVPNALSHYVDPSPAENQREAPGLTFQRWHGILGIGTGVGTGIQVLAMCQHLLRMRC